MFIELESLYLRELRRSDLDGNWYTWFNDTSVTKYQDKGVSPNTIEKQTAYYESLSESETDIVFAIVDQSTNKHIGNIGVHNINYLHRRCEIGIVIGENDFRGKGIAKKCIQEVSNYIFDTLNLRRITVFIMQGNIASIKSFESSGFEKEGTMRDYYFKNGKYLDSLIYTKMKKRSL